FPLPSARSLLVRPLQSSRAEIPSSFPWVLPQLDFLADPSRGDVPKPMHRLVGRHRTTNARQPGPVASAETAGAGEIANANRLSILGWQIQHKPRCERILLLILAESHFFRISNACQINLWDRVVIKQIVMLIVGQE